MSTPVKSWRAAIAPAVTVSALSLLVFLRLTPDTPSDYSKHASIAYQLSRGAVTLVHPLYHLVLVVFSGGQPMAIRDGQPVTAYVAAAVILALATGAAAGLTAVYCSRRAQVSSVALTGLCVILALAMPLPNWWKFPAVYLGQVSPNVWHNPTTIFCLPFALGAFVLSVRAIERFSIAVAAGLGVLLVLNLLAKPNYVLALAPCLAIALNRASETQDPAGRIRLPGQLLRFGLAFGPPALLLLVQAVAFDVERNTVSFDPFVEWGRHSPNIPASILVGITFPLAVLLTYYKQTLREPALLLAWGTLAVAVLQFALLSEHTTAPGDANWGWGMITANRVVFVATSEFLLRQPNNLASRMNWGVLGLHAVVGMVYLGRGIANPSGLCDF